MVRGSELPSKVQCPTSGKPNEPKKPYEPNEPQDPTPKTQECAGAAVGRGHSPAGGAGVPPPPPNPTTTDCPSVTSPSRTSVKYSSFNPSLTATPLSRPSSRIQICDGPRALSWAERGSPLGEGGLNRSAALGILRTSARLSTRIFTFAVNPGLSFKSGLTTVTTTS